MVHSLSSFLSSEVYAMEIEMIWLPFCWLLAWHNLVFFFLRSSRRSGGFLGSIMPDSISDALDPAHHHIVHNAAPAGIKRYDMLIEKVRCFSIIQVSKFYSPREKEKWIWSLIYKFFVLFKLVQKLFWHERCSFLLENHPIILICGRFLIFC